MVTDPTALYRLRDGVYAADLLIVAVAELDLFSWLDGRGSADVMTIAGEFGLADRPADVMITYLTAAGLLERRGEEVVVTALGRDHLVAGSDYDLRPYYASLRERPGCKELLGVLRTGQPAAWASADAGQDWAGRLGDPRFARRITAAMDARGRFLGPALADVLGDLRASRVLDIGGGSGVYASALADRLPVTAAVFERAPVDTAARTLLAERGYEDRVEVISGDMFTDPLPTGFDLHLFSHVLHDWDSGHVRSLLAASYAALAPGGLVVDHDVHVNASKTGPLPAAEYSVFLMHSTLGKCWSVSELTVVMQEAGFTSVTCRPTAADRSAIVAVKPGLRARAGRDRQAPGSSWYRIEAIGEGSTPVGRGKGGSAGGLGGTEPLGDGDGFGERPGLALAAGLVADPPGVPEPPGVAEPPELPAVPGPAGPPVFREADGDGDGEEDGEGEGTGGAWYGTRRWNRARTGVGSTGLLSWTRASTAPVPKTTPITTAARKRMGTILSKSAPGPGECWTLTASGTARGPAAAAAGARRGRGLPRPARR